MGVINYWLICFRNKSQLVSILLSQWADREETGHYYPK